MDMGLLGKKVKYVRINAQNEEQHGEGVVHAVFLGPERRVQVRVADGDSVFNIDRAAINATEAGAKRYVEHVRAVSARADHINAEIKRMAEVGNQEIEAMNTAFLGAPLP